MKQVRVIEEGKQYYTADNYYIDSLGKTIFFADKVDDLDSHYLPAYAALGTLFETRADAEEAAKVFTAKAEKAATVRKLAADVRSRVKQRAKHLNISMAKYFNLYLKGICKPAYFKTIQTVGASLEIIKKLNQAIDKEVSNNEKANN